MSRHLHPVGQMERFEVGDQDRWAVLALVAPRYPGRTVRELLLQLRYVEREIAHDVVGGVQYTDVEYRATLADALATRMDAQAKVRAEEERAALANEGPPGSRPAGTPQVRGMPIPISETYFGGVDLPVEGPAE